MIGWPSTSGIYEIINEGQVWNCDITGIDTKQAVDIYGKEESVLKSQMKRVKPNRHSKERKIPYLTKVIENHGKIILYVDIFFVKKITFYL